MRWGRVVVALTLVALSIATIFLSNNWRYQMRRAELAERREQATWHWTRFVMDSLGTTLALPSPPIEPWGADSLYWQWVATTARLQSRRWQQAVQHWVRQRGTMLDEVDVTMLQRDGLSDPPTQLRDDLQAHPELIPDRAVLGGSMQVDEILLLSPSYVFARYTDGHIEGAMLLEYQVASGRIAWKRLWSRLD